MHSPTLLILATILMGIMTLMLLATWRFNRQIAGFAAWTAAYFCGLLFCISLLLRPWVAETAAVPATQLLAFLMPYLTLVGVRAYVGARPLAWTWPVSGAVLLLGVAAWFTAVQPEPALRFILSSLISGSLFLLCARTIAAGKINDYPARYLCATACGGHGLFLLLRPWLFALGDSGPFDAQQMITVSQFIIVESIVAIVLMAFAIVMLANERMMLELRGMADRDPLTGTSNRRAFLTLLTRSISTAGRLHSPLSVLLIDLDHFKKINDTWGHRTGDEALRHFVAVAESCLRHGDVIGRMGGEEFAVLLPHTGVAAAEVAATRLRCAIEAQPVMHGTKPLPLTASIGIAHWQPGENADAVLNRADQAMYCAKNRGRNRVEVAAPAERPAAAHNVQPSLAADIAGAS